MSENVGEDTVNEGVGWYISDTHARRAIGYLTSSVPELGRSNVPKLAEAWADALEKTMDVNEPSPIGLAPSPVAEPPHPTAWGPEARAKIEQYRKDTPDAGTDLETPCRTCGGSMSIPAASPFPGKAWRPCPDCAAHENENCPKCGELLIDTDQGVRLPCTCHDVGAEPDSVERIAAEWGRLLAADNRRCPEGDDYTEMLQEADRFVRRLIVASRPSAEDDLRDRLADALRNHHHGCRSCTHKLRCDTADLLNEAEDARLAMYPSQVSAQPGWASEVWEADQRRKDG